MLRLLYKLLIFLMAVACSSSVDNEPQETDDISNAHQNWSYNLAVYEVNTRQYTAAGTFNAFSTHLDRLADMGVGILWFMPIHPIGSQNRLGSLGSPYSVKDYLAVNPSLGTLQDFRDLVKAIHDRGMYVIMDWVANHTAWDNALTTSNPDWYVTNSEGNFIPPPGTDWSDVIQLDYSNQDLREYMIDAMLFWVNEAGIDGFRYDAAGFVPADFWAAAARQLKKAKEDILLLAEDDSPQYKALGFDMSYGWGMYGFGNGILYDIANNFYNADDLDDYLKNEIQTYSGSHYRMYFTSNHDENSWYGTETELFGDAAQAFNVLNATVNGVQCIYNGQEAGLNKRLSFFDKDQIPWQEHDNAAIFKTLLHLKKENRALWNGSNGGRYQRVTASTDDIFAFVRKKDNDKIFAVFNLTSNDRNTSFSDTLYYGTYVEVFSEDTLTFSQSFNPGTEVGGWGYKLYKNLNTD